MTDDSRTYEPLGSTARNFMDPSPEHNQHTNHVPKDHRNIVYLSLLTAGIGFVLPYNSFIIASDYWSERFPTRSVELDLSCTYIIVAFASVLLNNIFLSIAPFRVRILFGKWLEGVINQASNRKTEVKKNSSNFRIHHFIRYADLRCPLRSGLARFLRSNGIFRELGSRQSRRYWMHRTAELVLRFRGTSAEEEIYAGSYDRRKHCWLSRIDQSCRDKIAHSER